MTHALSALSRHVLGYNLERDVVYHLLVGFSPEMAIKRQRKVNFYDCSLVRVENVDVIPAPDYRLISHT